MIKYSIDDLNEQDAKLMLKAIVAWNVDAIPNMIFNKNYIGYLDGIEVEVLEEDEQYTLTYKGAKNV